MRKRATGIATAFLVALALAGATVRAQQPSVRFYVPDPNPNQGMPSAEPFSGLEEIRYLMVLAGDRLPRNGGALTGLSFFALDSGRIVADDFSIVVGEAPSVEPDPEFDGNLKNSIEVYRASRLDRDGIAPGKLVTFPFTVPYPYPGGRTALAIQIRLRRLTQGVRLLGAPSRIEAVYTSGAESYGAQRATAAAKGLKSALDFLSSQPSVSSFGSALPGGNLGLTFTAASNIGDAYRAGCAFTTYPGIDIGEYTLPLNPDGLFFAVWRMPGVFQGFGGKITGLGTATGSIAIPDEPALIGVTFAVAFVTISGSGGITSSVTNVSTEHWVTIGCRG
ncbi:MAG: hypothetical protein JXQ29_06625 [Planctomycetes bacterium]|nr:hypothetical protein [Planctomycetota bacterium]